MQFFCRARKTQETGYRLENLQLPECGIFHGAGNLMYKLKGIIMIKYFNYT